MGTSMGIRNAGQRIEYLSVIGGFLDGLRITFGDGLNTIIGARGTGKTTGIEFVGYALDLLPSQEHAAQERKRIDTLVKRNLDGGRIEVGVRTKDGTAFRIMRSYGDDPIIVDEDGDPSPITLKSGLFRAEIYGQNAVESIADRPLFQLDLIDSFAGKAIDEINAREKQVVSILAANAHQLIPMERDVGAIQEELAGLPALETRLKAFADSAGAASDEINEAHRLKGLRDRESRTLGRSKSLVEQFRGSVDGLKGGLHSRMRALFDPEAMEGPNGDVLRNVAQSLSECGREVDQLLGQISDRLSNVEDAIANQAGQLDRQHKEQELAFRKTIEKHQQAQQQAADRAALDKQRNDLLAKQRLLEERRQQIRDLYKERGKLLEQLLEVRDERFAIRNGVAERINGQLSPTIRVTIQQDGDLEEYRSLVEGQLKGGGLKHGVAAEKVTKGLTPSELAETVRGRATDALVDRAELTPDQAAKAMACLSNAEFLFDLETVQLGDQPLIELKDGQDYKDTSSLSTGQKCTAILPILLLENENPLIIDQPEDNLDNRFIFQTVVESVSRVKPKRQLILVTHNPNIPVLGDADHVVVLESDGVHARVAKEGDVDACKEEIVTLLEGGAEAFRKRGERYGRP